MHTHITAWMMLALLVPAVAGARQHAPKPDASMVVTGSIEVTAKGDVRGYQLDHSDKLPQAVHTLLAKSIPQWTFTPPPLDDKHGVAKAHMQLRLLATPKGHDKYTTRVVSAWFGTRKGRAKDPRVLSYRHRESPHYPPALAQARFSGSVNLVVRINASGKVDKVAAAQVNLTTRGTRADMRRARTMFAKAATSAAEHWTFNVPTAGPAAKRDHWVAAIPVTFKLADSSRSPDAGYGQWVPFLPGTRHDIPWLQDSNKRVAANASALTGGVHLLHAPRQLELRTPLGSGG